MAKQSPIQKLEALSSKRKQSALSLESQLNEANETLAAVVASQNTSIETELSASQNLKKATKKDKEIKKNLAYRFPVVREKYAKLITDAKTQDAMAKSDASSAKTALVSISKKIDTLKKKKEQAVKLSEETTKQFSDAIRLQEKTIDDLSKLSDTDDIGSYDSALKEMAVKTEIQKRSKKDPEFSVARERAQAAVATAKQEIGMVQKRKTSSLFKSVGRTRDKAVDSDVERHVLGDVGEEGKEGQQGTRVRAEEFAQANPQLFNENELEGSAARELLEEAVQLSELALKATTSNADKIMGRISYLEKVATDAGDDEVAKMILDIIKPLKKSVAKKTTFRAMLKKRFTNYVGSLPEMFARKIPLIGGLIGDFMQQKKEAKEDTKEYRESQLEGISKKGQAGSGLKFENRGGRGVKQSTNDFMRGMGASTASESGILNGLGGASGVGGLGGASGVDDALSPSPSELTATTKSPIYEVLKSTYDKIVLIEELLHEAIDPEESALRDAEAASEADVGLLSKKGSKGGETKKEKSWLGSLISMLTDTLMPWIKGLFGPIGATILGLAKSAIGSITSVASKTVELGKSVGGKAYGAAKSIGGKAVDVVKNVGGKALGAAKSTGFFGKAFDVVKNVGGKALGAAKSIGGKALGKVADVAGSLGKGALKGFVKAVGGVGKFAKVLLKAPVIGPLIQAAITGFQISSIKKDATLSSKEKKKEIGKTLGSGLGGMIGSVGGAALGSIFPGPGTILGAIGGGILGDYLGGIIADQIGGEEIYNLVRSIPGLGDLINVDDDAEKKKDMAGPATGLPAASRIKEVQKNDPYGGDDLLSPSSPAEKKEGLKRIGTSIQAELDSRKESGTSVAPNMSKSGYRIEQNGKVMSEANSEREIGMKSSVIDTNIEMGKSNIKSITDNDLQRRLKEIKEETAVSGTIARPSTPNTTVGQQVQKYNGEKSALEEVTAKASQVGVGGKGTSVVNAPTNTVVNNNTNIQQSGGTRPNERTAMLMNRETATH